MRFIRRASLACWVLLCACGTGGVRPDAAPAVRPSPPPSPTPTEVPAPGLFVVGEGGAELAPAPAAAASSSLRENVVLPFHALDQGWAQITTPCENQGWLLLDSGSRRGKQRVLLDPGHGGDEPGAAGPSLLIEKELNLDIARRTAALLEAEEVETALTRYEDYRATLVFRAEIAKAVRPDAMISIHHNAEPDGTMDRPGTETFYQHDSPTSKRLAGLVYEETVQAFSRFPASWVGNRDAGAKWRLNSRGTDYYGILRHTFAASITSVLSESAFISNPSEEALLRRDDVRVAEAQALSKAILRFLRTDDPGSGFTTPYPRASPAGPGGGRVGCVDPT